MRLRRTAPQAPTLQLVQRSTQYVVRDGWVWSVALVRLPDGSTDWYELPDHRLGSL